MTLNEIIDGLERYTAGRIKKERVFIPVEELQQFIDAIKPLVQVPTDNMDDVRNNDVFQEGYSIYLLEVAIEKFLVKHTQEELLDKVATLVILHNMREQK